MPPQLSDDQNDDERKVLNALSEIAHKISFAKDKQSQKKQRIEQKNTNAFNGKLTKKQIDRIVAAVNRGDIKPPRS